MMIKEIRKLIAKKNTLRGKNSGLLRDFDDELASGEINTFLLDKEWSNAEIDNTIVELLHSKTEVDNYIGLLIIQESYYLSPTVVNTLVSNFKSVLPTTQLYREFLYVINHFHISVPKNIILSTLAELKRQVISGQIDSLDTLGRLACIFYQRNARDGTGHLIYFMKKDYQLDDPGYFTRTACEIANLIKDSYRPLIPLLQRIRSLGKNDKFKSFVITQVGCAMERNKYLYRDTEIFDKQKNSFLNHTKRVLF